MTMWGCEGGVGEHGGKELDESRTLSDSRSGMKCKGREEGEGELVGGDEGG